MKKENKILTGVALGVGATFATCSYILAKKIYKGSVGDKPYIDSEAMEEYYKNKEDKPLDLLSNYNSEKFSIESIENKYYIDGINIKANEETSNTVVIVHGIRSNYYETLNVAYGYLKNGFNAILYNQRNTGETGGENYTFGLFERYDLDTVVAYAKEKYKDGVLGVHGFSMGAATSTMHTALNEKDKKVDFYILDAPFEKMETAIELGVKGENIKVLPVKYATFIGNLFTRIKGGFWYKDVQPYKEVSKTTVPVMIIHGTEDKVTSIEGSEKILNNIPHDLKELWKVEGFGHCTAVREIEDEYFEKVMGFINKYILENK